MTRVLVVDDKEDNLYYLTALLTANGFQVETARDGSDALDKARQCPPELVITDLLMPVMDGYTLLRHWKADERLQNAPFIVYTATYTDPEDEQLAHALGADAFILKPSEPDAFLARVRAVQKNARAGRPVAPNQPSGDLGENLQAYSQTLVRKLEQRTLQLEERNQILRDSEERFRQLAENIEDVFWLSDPGKMQMLYVSPAYARIWGRSCTSLLEHPASWLAGIHPEDRARVEATLPNQLLGPWEETYRIVRPDRSVRWIRDRAFPVRNAENEVYRVAGVSRDITQYRLLEDQFRQAQKMEAIGRLAGGIAHDFNNLLSVILSYASMVVADLEPGDPNRVPVEQIHRAGERAAALTRQLLAFSRQQPLEPRVTDLAQVVREMEPMLARLLGADIELRLHIGALEGRVYVDAGQFEQVVMNLAVNARDAMPRGGALEIGLQDVQASSEEPARVELSVTDTGTGMDDATRERIFEPFFTTKERGKGTGLGLATVFGIVEQSRGAVRVASEVGRGTTFSVSFPCTAGVVAQAPTRVPHHELRGTETVLLVEDDEQVRQASCAILRRNGYTVLEAQSAQHACELAANHGTGPIHLLMTDVVMPRMSGRELASQLAPARPQLKVLFVSGYTERVVTDHGVRTAKDAFLPKPIEPAALLRKVRDVLGPR